MTMDDPNNDPQTNHQTTLIKNDNFGNQLENTKF